MMGTASCAPRKIPLVSAYEAEDGTPHIVFTRTSRGPLCLMMTGVDVVWLDCVRRTIRAAPDTKERTISHAWKRMAARGCVMIIHEFFNMIYGAFSGLCLLIGDFVECRKAGGVTAKYNRESVWYGLDARVHCLSSFGAHN